MAKFTCNFISYTLQRTVDITVVLPTVTIPESMGAMFGNTERPRHTPKHKYPVLYLLHGMGNNHATWTGYTNVEMFAEERQIAVVNLSAENKSYVNFDAADMFYDFIRNELPDFICGMFPISDKPADTYIAGLSMGGFGTLVHALHNPEKYAAFGAFSAAVQLNPHALIGGGAEATKEADPENDPAALAEAIHSAGGKFPKAYIACGAKDFLFEANKEFRDKLLAYGADVTWEEHPDYGHEWRFWNLQIERFLDWLPRTDAYAKAGRRQI